METGFSIAIRALVRESVTLILFFLMLNFWWGDEQWFKDKVKELSGFLAISVMFFLSSIITRFFSRPIVVTLSQQNARYSLPSTTFSVGVSGITQEHERTTELSVEVTRNKSIWGKFVAFCIRRSTLTLLVESVTPGIILVAEDEMLRSDIASVHRGFHLKIGDYLMNVLKHSSAGLSHAKKCSYVLEVDRNHHVTSEIFQIVPRLVYNNRQAPWWLFLFVKFSVIAHTVHFTRD